MNDNENFGSFKKLLRFEPPATYFADAYLSIRKPDQAADALLKRWMDIPEIDRERRFGRVHLLNESWKEAIKSADVLIAHDPADLDAMEIKIAAEDGQRADAAILRRQSELLSAAEGALSDAETSPTFNAIERALETLKAFHPHLKDSRALTMRFYKAWARYHTLCGNMPGVEDAARMIVDRFPLDDYGWGLLEASLKVQGKHEEATDTLRRKAAAKEAGDLVQETGRLMASGKRSQAKETLLRAETLFPGVINEVIVYPGVKELLDEQPGNTQGNPAQ